ncbi:endo alpha-1,4 polygalactosaminidase [Chitinophaga sp. 212800010-3]|uniref:endo alpha-1,4 polygalactosaminidase n=1 Tax=unclassified Chitinophaga TaxID=2619133 RepID=UPI002DEDEC33|nr:Glyco-hydro-114 domain-containing protein [Chitinophaga sp. 212800010-3]
MPYHHTAIAVAMLLISCSKQEVPPDNTGTHQPPATVNYRQEMRNFIQEISAWARTQQPSFIVVAQNGSELLSASGKPTDTAASAYVKALNGIGREELLYGYNNNDNASTPTNEKNLWLSFCKMGAASGLKVMTTDYCTTPEKMADSYRTNNSYGFISFAATKRQLNNIPAGSPYQENVGNINTLADAKNFLYYINMDNTGEQFVAAVKATNYDVLVIDAFSPEGTPWPKATINALKVKQNGAKRLVLAYMSIGQAEQYRWYWKSDWKKNPPAWMEKHDPYWDGSYYVRYWMTDWKNLIYGNANAYTQKILDAGFDGTYLDPEDGSAYWEEH